jgi:PPOX class probable F420-dependent enzyme
MIDPSTPFGQRVARRLAEERIIWLTTVSPGRVPHPRPVWFWWDGQTFLIYSKPGTFKLDHIEANPNVALNFDGDGVGGDIIVFTGQTRLDPAAPPAHQVPEYAEKYRPGFKRIGMTAEEFGAAYSVALRVTPTSLRGH